jgi:AraC family transcriptional regulator
MDAFQFKVNPRWPDLARCNVVLNGNIRARSYVVSSYQTNLCVKAVARGSALYGTRQGRYLVDADTFLILNQGQEYSLEIAAGSDTETVCPFFQPGFLGHVAHCLTRSPDWQLDEPTITGGDPGFHERLYPGQGSKVVARLRALHVALHSPAVCSPWLEDHFYGLAGDLLDLRDGVQREVAAFPASRSSTREELYRRLHRARDFIDSCFAESLSVERIARVACLSPYHFHRTFRLAFGETPMHRLQARRLRAASQLLIATDRPVTAISLQVGFESLGTFSWLFRKHFGHSPREFRGLRRKR